MTAHRTRATQGRGAIVVFALSALLLQVLAPGALLAQVAVFPIQNLSFGTIRAGMPEYVSPDDVARRAELELVGSGTVVITLALPADMVSAGGHRVPLLFDRGDGMFVSRGPGRGKDRTFDPNKPSTFHINARDGGGTLCLGATALPSASQPPGRYTATITVQVVAPGT
jgi:hypothetical protein